MIGDTTHLTPERLDELERLEREATPGPWTCCCAPGCECGLVWADRADRPAVNVACAEYMQIEAAQCDKALVASLRNAAPALLRAARERDEWRALANAAHVHVIRDMLTGPTEDIRIVANGWAQRYDAAIAAEQAAAKRGGS